MATLENSTIASTYDQLLALPSNGGNGTTHVALTDGNADTTFGFTIASDALMMTSTNRLEFGDTGTYIHQSADGVLDLVSDTEMELNATTLDINAAVDISGNVTMAGTLDINAAVDISGNVTMAGNIIMGDDTSIGIGDADERIEFDGAGDISLLGCNVGIGTATPDSPLNVVLADLSDTAKSGIRVMGKKSGGSNRYADLMVMYNASGTGATDQTCALLRLSNTNGDANYIWIDDNNDMRVSETQNDVGSTGGTAIGTQTSDERLKDISSDPFPYGLTEVNKLVPIQYKLKKSKNQVNKIGFGAQTTKPIIPEAVYDTGGCIDGYDQAIDDDGNDKSIPRSDNKDTRLAMEYVQIIPVLVKAMQELSAKVTALENA